MILLLTSCIFRIPHVAETSTKAKWEQKKNTNKQHKKLQIKWIKWT